MNVFDVVNTIKSAIEEQFDSIVHEGNTELSWFDIEDDTREAADKAFDDQMIDTTDIINTWQNCGMPESPTGEGDILSQMQDGLYEDIFGDLDTEDVILDYISDNTAPPVLQLLMHAHGSHTKTRGEHNGKDHTA